MHKALLAALRERGDADTALRKFLASYGTRVTAIGAPTWIVLIEGSSEADRRALVEALKGMLPTKYHEAHEAGRVVMFVEEKGE